MVDKKEISIVPSTIPMTTGAPQVSASLDALLRLIYDVADGTKSTGEIAEATGLDFVFTKQIVAELIERGLMTIAGGDHGQPAAVEAEKPKPPPEKSDIETQVEQMYSSRDELSHYRFLGVDPDAPRNHIRDRYFELSKKFHPDKSFRLDNDALKEKMGLVFRQLTIAYDVLSNANRRKEYDATIAGEIELFNIEKKLKRAMAPPETSSEPTAGEKEIKKATNKEQIKAPPQEAKSADTPTQHIRPRPTTAPEKKVTAHPRATSNPKSRPVRSTLRPIRPPPSPSIPSRSMVPSAQNEDRRQQLKRQRAAKALKEFMTMTSMAPRTSQAPAMQQTKASVNLLDQARIALEQHSYKDALVGLKEVLENDPGNVQAKELLKVAHKGYSRMVAQDHLRRGKEAQREGRVREAEAMFQRALDTDVNNVEARHLLAILLLGQKRDLPRALTLAKEVIVLGGQRADYFANLGEIYLLAKDDGRAAEMFKKALSIEPGNKEYKKRLKLCRN